MAMTPYSDRLVDPRVDDPISAKQTVIQNDMLRKSLGMPDSISDSTGTRMIVRRSAPVAHQFVEITYIDDTARSFEMKDYGVCIGKLITYLPDEDWAVQYPGSLIEDGDEVFCGFVDQSRAGVPGQRYYARSYGNKTCGTLELPLVMLEGGAPTAAILAEDHPGCGTVFEVWIAPVWNPTSREWDTTACDGATKYKAIDLREGVPQPNTYATGLFAPRVDLTYGVILEALEIDCTSPGACGFCL